MGAYEELYKVVADWVWNVFKDDPPEMGVLKAMIKQQMELNLTMLPKFKALRGTFNEDGFVESMAKEYWSKNSVKQTEGNYLFSAEGGYEPWLAQADQNGEFSWEYWNQYRRYLEDDMKWSRDVCNAISKDTWEILNHTHNPQDTKFTTQGLVIGDVQSGKTANYLGLMCRAADVGYNYLVVLASTTNDLRAQTQQRVEEGFIGFCFKQDENNKKSFKRMYVGVGDGAEEGFKHPNPGTSRMEDFKKAKMETFLNIGADNVKEPWVFIIKKNTSTLNNLITWLRLQHIGENDKLLLIDDEADYASINTKYSKQEISTINRLIRDLFHMFRCRTYVAYTATPYANILIDRDTDDEEHGRDLFPEDFIYTLTPSDSYFGASKIFADIDEDEEGVGTCKYVRFINDCVPPSKKDVAIDVLPPTLKDAVRTFLLASALWTKRLAGRSRNMTMLVNVSQFNLIQGQYQRLIDYYLSDVLKPAIRLYGSLSSEVARKSSQEIAELEYIWNMEYRDSQEYSPSFTWEEILPVLNTVAEKVKTRLIHHKSKEKLEYESGKECVIAIGGNRLSRGLTLDGLVVSYFARNSRAYDTLMQMSRWFGHRVGYEDICRVWMTAESAGWCKYIANSTDDLMIDLVRMEKNGATPREFGLRIRAHPSTLMVTARNKMGAGELRRKICLDGQYVETYALLRGKLEVEENFAAAGKLKTDLEKGGYQHEKCIVPKADDEMKRECLGELVHDVPVSEVESFIAAFHNCNDAKQTIPENVLKHIGYCKDVGAELWDVLFAGPEHKEGKGQSDYFFKYLDAAYDYERRRPGIVIDKKRLFVANRNKVSTKNPERAGLEVSQIIDIIRELRERKEKGLPCPSFDYMCTRARRKPLLVIHHLNMKFPNEKAYIAACSKGDERYGTLDANQWQPYDHSEPMIAWSISFPELNIKKETEYVFNKVALEEMYHGDDGQDEDSGVDDEDEL